MALCALCDTFLAMESDSKEHVIPNGVGGRRKVKGFICVSCNSKTGEQWDSELCRQLNPLSLLFSITKDRGGFAPSQTFHTTSGDKYTLHHHGGMTLAKPVFEKEIQGDKIAIHIVARDMDEAKRMLKELKGKYPSVDVEGLLANANVEREYLDSMLKMEFGFGGPKAGRSVVKSVLALAVSNGVDPKVCEEANKYLRSDGEPCFGFFYEKDLLKERPVDHIFHCVVVQSNPETGLLLGYLEYFGVKRVVVCLSREYSGPVINCCYAINPVTGEELDICADLDFSQDDIAQIYEYGMCDRDAILRCFDEVVPLAMKNSLDKERDRVVGSAVENAFKNCGAREGEELSEAQIKKLIDGIVDEVSPFILRTLRQS